MNRSVPAIVFSSWRESLPENVNNNALQAAEIELAANGIPYFSALGFYKGNQEPVFVLQDVADNLKTVRKIARWNGQESILLIDANRRARLETVDGDLIGALGQFCEITETESKQVDAWTLCDGRYFSTRGDA